MPSDPNVSVAAANDSAAPSRASSKASSLGGASSTAGAIPIELSQHESLEWGRSSVADASTLRHRTEYQHIRTLGRGAFGTTHLVRNVVDSRLYALKCVVLGSNEQFGTEACKRVLREVDALSSLKNDHVVRYYGAWVERGTIEAEDDSSTVDLQRGESSYAETTDSYTEYYPNSSARADRPSTDAACSISQEDNEQQLEQQCMCNLCHKEYVDWEVSFESWGLLESVLQPLNLCVDCYKNSIPEHIDTEAIVIREKRRMMPECLYILMGYAGNDLNDEIHKMATSMSRGNTDAKTTTRRRWELFGQCVKGLNSIHKAGFSHRDIKCSNIFVDDDLATIGDLGLASVASAGSVAYCNSEAGDITASHDAMSASSDVGTLLYSAPEVATGRYDKKCDIYSLGIVLIELFAGFITGMERIKVLSKIRESGEISEDLGLDSTVLELARRMTNHKVESRPSCGDILEYLMKNNLPISPDTDILLNLVKDLRTSVERLERKVSEKDVEINRLRELLHASGISA